MLVLWMKYGSRGLHKQHQKPEKHAGSFSVHQGRQMGCLEPVCLRKRPKSFQQWLHA